MMRIAARTMMRTSWLARRQYIWRSVTHTSTRIERTHTEPQTIDRTIAASHRLARRPPAVAELDEKRRCSSVGCSSVGETFGTGRDGKGRDGTDGRGGVRWHLMYSHSSRVRRGHGRSTPPPRVLSRRAPPGSVLSVNAAHPGLRPRDSDV